MPNPSTHAAKALQRTTLAACLSAALAVGSGAVFAAAAIALPGKARPQASAFSPGLAAGAAARLPHSLMAAPSASGPWSFDRSRIAPNSSGAIQAVANCNDSGTGSLRAAVTAAVDGDTIDLSALTCSTITLTTGAIEITAKDLTLQGPGQDALRVSGNHASQVMRSAKYADNLAINDMTIADGHATTALGGCIYSGSSITLERVTVTGCLVSDASVVNASGGGVAALHDLVLVQSTVTGNTASGVKSGYGGGVFSLKYAVAMDGSSVDHNVAIGPTGKARGGGMAAGFMEGGVVAIYSRVSDNQVRSTSGTAFGGGMFGSGSVDDMRTVATVAFSTISGNSAHSDENTTYAGGILAGDLTDSGTVSGSMQLFRSTISGNSVTSDCASCVIVGGGAVAFGQILADSSTIRDNTVLPSSSGSNAVGGGLATSAFHLPTPEEGQITLINSTISGNRATGSPPRCSYGGGMALGSGLFVSLLSTITDNQASCRSGGVFVSPGTTESGLFSSVIANNSAPDGADIGSYGSTPITLQGSHSLVRLVSSNITLPADTLNADPKLLPLTNNGGPTATHALAACSPAIDAGMNITPPAEFDQRGDPFVRDYGAAPDIGAFERQPDTERIFNQGFEASPCT